MKTFKYLLAAVMLTIATAASAQFANTGSKSGGFSLGTVKTDDYSRFKVSYLNADFSVEPEDEDFNVIFEEPLQGVSIEYLYGKHITQNLPLFVESGINISWASSSVDKNRFEADLNFVYFTVPVNLAYKLSINDDFSIDPHFGLGFRFNVLAKESWEYDGYEKWSGSWFDKDDTDGDPANRFQLCGQAGIGLCYQKLYLGWEYSWNFMEFADDAKINGHYLSVGINF